MEDKTFDVKISEDFHNKVMEMIDSSGITSKEWFEKAVVLTEIHDLNFAAGDHNQDFSELEVHTTRIHELVANMMKREINLKNDAVKRIGENLAEREVQLKDLNEVFAASLENSNKEMVELNKQIAEMSATNVKTQSLIGALSTLVAEQEMQLKDLKEVFGTREREIASFAARVDNSKKENVALHKQVDEMKATNENNQSLIGKYKEKIDSISGLVSKLSNHQSEPRAKDKISLEKADRNSQKKSLKKLLKKHPNAKENELAELLGVDSSYIVELRKEFGI